MSIDGFVEYGVCLFVWFLIDVVIIGLAFLTHSPLL